MSGSVCLYGAPPNSRAVRRQLCAAGFRAACIALLTDPARAQALGQRAAAYVREAHAWAENARRVEAVYERVRNP